MDLEAIKALGEQIDKLAADDCALFLWSVMPQLPEALEVITAWGFRYKTAGFTWVKLNKSGEGFKTGMGYWTRANPELCLLATRGAPERLNKDVAQLMTEGVITVPLQDHSAKPREVHGRIENAVGALHRFVAVATLAL